MIYCAQRNEVESIAKAFLKAVKAGWIKALPTKEPLLIGDRINELAEWLEPNHHVFEALRNGLAVHHARLPRPVLRLIELLLADRLVSAVVASPTLAQGLNLKCPIGHLALLHARPMLVV